MRLLRPIIAIGICLSLAFGASAQTFDSFDSSDYLIKAGFIYNFANLVGWPQGGFAQTDSPIVIGILGTDPFGGIIDRILADKQIDARHFVIKRLKWGMDLKGCDILFIGSSEAAHLEEVIHALKGVPVLTIGETPGFAKRGCIINLIVEDNKVDDATALCESGRFPDGQDGNAFQSMNDLFQVRGFRGTDKQYVATFEVHSPLEPLDYEVPRIDLLVCQNAIDNSPERI